MSTAIQNPAPPLAENAKRRLRNYLLDSHFQLKFTSYMVLVAVVVAGLLGVFLYRTTQELFTETENAVEARSLAAETSRELGNATLNNEILARMNDPALEEQLRQLSEAIDQRYEAERNAIFAARSQLVHRQKRTLWVLVLGMVVFTFFVALAGIVATHRIVGPMFRMKRLAQQVAEGHLLPARALREHDELKDVFESFAAMVIFLRQRYEEDLAAVVAAREAAQRPGGADDVGRKLEGLEARLRAILAVPGR